MRERPQPLQVYKHFKGNYYQVLSIAVHSETREELVIYRPLFDMTVYARPLDMFLSEVDHDKYPDVEQKYRFALVTGKVKNRTPNSDDIAEGEDSSCEKCATENPVPVAADTKDEIKSVVGTIEEPKVPVIPQNDRTEETISVEKPENDEIGETDEKEGNPQKLSLDNGLAAFLDAPTYAEKIEHLERMRGRIDENILNTISAALDFESYRDDIDGKYQEILDWLKTKEKYECTRLRF